jgi:hypothetical protein
MTITKFKYLKESATEPKEYELLVLNKDEGHINGISLGGLHEEVKESILAIVKEYEEKLKPYMQFYRNFKKDCIIPEKKE